MFLHILHFISDILYKWFKRSSNIVLVYWFKPQNPTAIISTNEIETFYNNKMMELKFSRDVNWNLFKLCVCATCVRVCVFFSFSPSLSLYLSWFCLRLLRCLRTLFIESFFSFPSVHLMRVTSTRQKWRQTENAFRDIFSLNLIHYH